MNEKNGLAGLLNAEGVDKIRRANTGVNGTLVISTQQSLGHLLSIRLGMNCNTLSSVFPRKLLISNTWDLGGNRKRKQLESVGDTSLYQFLAGFSSPSHLFI